MGYDIVSPIPTRATRAANETFAEKTRREVGLETGFDLGRLCEINRGRVQMVGPLDEVQGRALDIAPDGAFTVYRSSLRSSLGNHMIIARELGHVLLHWPKVRAAHPGAGMYVPCQSDDEAMLRCKWEATWFARAFLMPEAEFREAWERGGLEHTRAFFAVTAERARERAAQLGIESVPEPCPHT
ncbi:hypothetical protein OCH239_10835 [Roseivivax halodurans JCM 10272]|uniref:IrrE N-terminal-like domain-containing protein n=1 Tax=Roseivivax halodurans JCM 10272 TaxID=1449350 RepID=X7EBU5_9RHOB|nr:ImmA/IrrE family metallo-endopeptidase [Roseivivax halodurans]ETX13330.1 hypothetical protein OCH239_10835 [Roseivivax halodurans JCM 10272]